MLITRAYSGPLEFGNLAIHLHLAVVVETWPAGFVLQRVKTKTLA